MTGSEEASTCQVLNKDKSGPLIRSLALASISLHLSAVKDTEAEGKGGFHSHLFLSVSIIVLLDPRFILVRATPPLHPILSFAGFLSPVRLALFSLCVPHSLSMIIENSMETVPECSEQRPLLLAGLHSTLTCDWLEASM